MEFDEANILLRISKKPEEVQPYLVSVLIVIKERSLRCTQLAFNESKVYAHFARDLPKIEKADENELTQ